MIATHSPSFQSLRTFPLSFLPLIASFACSSSPQNSTPTDQEQPNPGNSSTGGALDTGTGATGNTMAGAPSSGGSVNEPTGGSTGKPEEREEEPGYLCESGVWEGQTPRLLPLSGNTFAHDPTMIKEGDTYYRFWTGAQIPVASSNDLLNWRNAPSVYARQYPAWVSSWLEGVRDQTFNFPWAPDVSFFNGKTHIYSSFSAKFGDNISCITHLSTESVREGNWTDHGPIFCTEGNERYNAIDADVELDEEGTPWLAFGSFWDGIFAFELNQDGSRKNNEMTRLAWARQIEAPVLFRRCDYYYLFVTWGLCCPGEGRTVDQLSYRVAVGRSENIMGPYIDRDGKPLLEGGGSLIVEGDKVQWAAAGHSDVLVDGDKIYHTYHAYRQRDGQAQLRIAELWFDEQGWPVPHAP